MSEPMDKQIATYGSRNSGYVYFIDGKKARNGAKLVKIGRTRLHPLDRLGDLRVAIPEAKVSHAIETNDAARLERELHRQFWRYHAQREWFYIPKDKLNQVFQVGRVVFGPVAYGGGIKDREVSKSKRVAMRLAQLCPVRVSRQAWRGANTSYSMACQIAVDRGCARRSEHGSIEWIQDGRDKLVAWASSPD